MVSRKLTDFDVLVAGGGPAGLSAAAEAARQGSSVLLVERERTIGQPVRTSGATSPSLLRDFQIPPHLYHVVRNLRIIGPTQSACFRLEDEAPCVIDVTGVYQYLANAAATAGTIVLTGVTANALVEDGRVVGARLSGSPIASVRAGVVIDATGYRACLTREIGMHDGFRRFGVGAEFELEAPHCDQDELVIIVGSRFAPHGYAWAFPWGGTRVRLGVGVLNADTRVNPRDCLTTLWREAAALGIDLRDARIIEEHRGLIPADGLPRALVGNGILAVGDAAGQASLVAGEGIRISLRAGLRAGRVAAEAVQNGDVSQPSLYPYEAWFRREHGLATDISHRVHQRLMRWDEEEWDRKVALLRGINGEQLASLLQGTFSVKHAVRWLARYPSYWRHDAGYGLGALGRLFVRAVRTFIRRSDE